MSVSLAFSAFWLPHEPFAVSRIKDLSTYLIYLFLVLASDRRRCRFRRGSGDDLLRSIEEQNLKKRQRRRSAAARLIFFQEGLRRTPDQQGVFAPGHSSDRSVLLVYPSLVEGRSDGGYGEFSHEERFVREGDLAGVDEWLFIAAENIPVIRLLSTEKCNSRTVILLDKISYENITRIRIFIIFCSMSSKIKV